MRAAWTWWDWIYLTGFGVFSPSDLNIKPSADLHSCDARCTGTARSHCTAHVLINMAPTALSTPSSPPQSPSLTHPPASHMLSQHVFDDRVAFRISRAHSSSDPSFDAALSPDSRLSDSSLSRHLSCRLLSGM